MEGGKEWLLEVVRIVLSNRRTYNVFYVAQKFDYSCSRTCTRKKSIVNRCGESLSLLVDGRRILT